VSGSSVYAGGLFTGAGGLSRNGLAAIDLTNGQLTSWNPAGDGGITTMALSGSTMYVTGYFTSIGGQPRSYAAAVDVNTGLATGFNPNPNSDMRALTPSGGTVYAGGYFTNIGGQPRSHIAALDPATGLAQAWNPPATGGTNPAVHKIAVVGSTVYAGGEFTTIGGQSRNNIAALDATSGLATAWNPNVTGGAFPGVYTLVSSGSLIYAAGQFTTVAGQSRSNLAA